MLPLIIVALLSLFCLSFFIPESSKTNRLDPQHPNVWIKHCNLKINEQHVPKASQVSFALENCLGAYGDEEFKKVMTDRRDQYLHHAGEEFWTFEDFQDDLSRVASEYFI